VTRSLRVAAVALALLTLAACSSKGGHHDSTDGPLRTTLGGGGNSIAVPRKADWPWPATFGGLLICADEKVTLLRVEPHYRMGRPADISFAVRTVPDAARRTGPQEAWGPVITRAMPLDRLARRHVRFERLTPLKGTTVDEPCLADPLADDPYTEILTTLEVDEGGVWIDRLDVHYRAGGRQHVLRVGWSYVGCGRAITDRDVCWVD